MATLTPGTRAMVRHPAFPAVTGTVVAVDDRDGRAIAVLDVPGAETIRIPVGYLEVQRDPARVS